MSPSWLERVDIGFAAGALALARGRRFGGPVPAPQRFEVTASADAKAPAWQAPLERLARLLASERPAPARVRLSGKFCRLGLAPWAPGLTAEEERALARAVFVETYGDAARSWEVRADNLKRGAALVACAIDAELLARLRGAFDEAGWRLESVEPLFAAALAGAGEIPGPAQARWHALLEPDWCSAALIEGDAFLALCGVPVLGLPGAVARAIDNENVRLSREVRSLRLLPGSGALPAEGDFSGWTVAQA